MTILDVMMMQIQPVSKSLEMAGQGYHTTVVADDTDILVLLLNKWTPPMSDVTLRHEATKE